MELVCPAVIVSSDLWKIGQVRPGDTIRFRRSVANVSPILFQVSGRPDRVSVCLRHSGENYLLLEYGLPVLDLELRFRVQALMDALLRLDLPGIIDLTPGIRSLQVHYDSDILPRTRLLTLPAGTVRNNQELLLTPSGRPVRVLTGQRRILRSDPNTVRTVTGRT